MKKVSTGVPQGSILGPLFPKIDINHIFLFIEISAKSAKNVHQLKALILWYRLTQYVLDNIRIVLWKLHGF